MALNAETEKILGDLEASGFDLSGIRKQVKGNPLLENAANSKLGGALLRREEYTRFKDEADREAESLRQQVRTLAAAQDHLKTLEGNEDLYRQALEVIQVQRDNLVQAGFDPEEVKNLSFAQEAGLKAAIGQAKEIEDKEKVMPEKKQVELPDNLVTSDNLQTVAANLIGGNIVSAVDIAHHMMRANRLGIEVDDAMVDKFKQEAFLGLQHGKQLKDVADEVFGIPAKLAEIQKKQQDEANESEVRRRVAEQLKAAGVNSATVASATRGRSTMHQIAERVNSADAPKIEGSGGTRVLGGRTVPVNKDGEVEHYRLRGDRTTRVNNAIKEMEELEGRRPELFEEVY